MRMVRDGATIFPSVERLTLRRVITSILFARELTHMCECMLLNSTSDSF